LIACVKPSPISLADSSHGFPDPALRLISDWTNTTKRHTALPRASLLTLALLAVCARACCRACAEAVRNYLVQVGGMPANLITATGVGSDQPETAANDCKGMKVSQALITCLRVDRRVEVQVLGSQPQR
jgi:hypothetical protein